LQQRDGQVVLTSDGSPAELSAFSGELQSRVSGGLAVEFQPPSYDARLAIVRTMVERLNVRMDGAVDEMIAKQAVGSARLLSGAVNRLVATSMAVKRPINVELAGTVLTEFARQNVAQVRLVDIQRAVCQVFGVESASLKSPSRSRRTSEPRMLAMYLARRYTRAALSEIGDFFGGRSHSTVASAQRKCERLISENSQLNVHDQPCPVEEALRRVETAMRTA
jgi:chromosomal replication initiator protein